MSIAIVGTQLMYLIKSNSSKKKGGKYNSLILAQFYISITPKNNRKPKTFSDIFRDYRNRKLDSDGLNH